ncbi:hypothetical protein IWQ61_002754 [Dispira simplex]|nr:hypothetical protein IWQ61_002754 [Dispira simplex]
MAKHSLAEHALSCDIIPTNQHYSKRPCRRSDDPSFPLSPTVPTLCDSFSVGLPRSSPCNSEKALLNPFQPHAPFLPCPTRSLSAIPAVVPQYPYLSPPLPPVHPLFPCSLSSGPQSLPCPLCKIRSLQLHAEAISCPCGLRINTGHPSQSDRESLSLRLESCFASHHQRCTAEPTVILEPFVDLDNQALVLQCHQCQLYKVLI